MIVKTYDPESFALAEHFMQDAPQVIRAPKQTRDGVKYDFTHDLALHIQQTIEDWFEARAHNGWAPLLEPVMDSGDA